MKARTYLERYERLYRQAERLTEQIRNLNTLAMGLGAIQYDRDRVKTSPGEGLMGLIDRKVNLERVLDDTIDEMIVLKKDMENLFSMLVNRDHMIAELTWLDFEGSIYISQKLGISRQTVFRRRRAIEMIIQELLDKDMLP